LILAMLLLSSEKNEKTLSKIDIGNVP